MHTRFAYPIARAALISGFLFATTGLTALTSAPAAVKAGPAKISATYKLRFAGLSLGNFKIWSNVQEGRYSLQGQGNLKFLAGFIFELKGGTASSGRVSEKGALPHAFSFNFKTKKKRGQLVMQFNDGTVSQVASQPPLKVSSRAVPVTKKHVQGVLDPLTALFYSARAKQPGKHASVCDKRVPVYDGLYRFDLQLSHKRTVRVVRKGKSGYGGPAVICRIKFIPVAGHRPAAGNTVFMSQTDDIEAWLIPTPDGRMYVPYHVSIPTPYGVAQATSTAMNIEMAGQKRVALVH
jgi:hypothetical protein